MGTGHRMGGTCVREATDDTTTVYVLGPLMGDARRRWLPHHRGKPDTEVWNRITRTAAEQDAWDELNHAAAGLVSWMSTYGTDWCGPEGGLDGWLNATEHAIAALRARQAETAKPPVDTTMASR